MKQNLTYVGLDVDDGSALGKGIGKVIDLRCQPTLKGLLVHQLNGCNTILAEYDQ